ncbi:MAG: alpha/beta hydrolase [Anaerolineae bacterium]|nr:alpha/beta hydrolase [Anaerolineae bacterium]
MDASTTVIPSYYTHPDGYHAMMRWYQAALARLTVPYDSIHVETRFGPTHVLLAGPIQAPPVLLIHGINVNALGWKRQITQLASDYRIIAPDVVGFAGRSAPIRLPYHNDDYALWIADLLDALGIDRVVLVGSSAGGFFVLKFGAVFPDRTRALALINPCGLARYPYPLDWARHPIITRLIGDLARPFATIHTARRLVRASASPQAPLMPETIHLAYLLLKYFRRYPPPGKLPDRQLQAIRAPVLLLLGEFEPYFRPETLIRSAQQALDDLRVQVIPNAGHDIHNDQAETVSGHLRDFIRTLR